MRINNNLMAMNTHRQLGISQNAGAKSMEKLSSGFRINRAGDDAAGLAISEKMRAQVRGLNQASKNAQDGISMIQTAEGALQETHAILQRMRELSVQGSTDALNAQDRQAIGQELKDLTSEIDRISKTTEFNGKKLLNGSLSTTDSGTGSAKVGKVGANSTISNIDVSGALANETYTFADAGGGKITLTRSSDSVAQTVTGEATIGADGKMNLNFDQLGVSIEVAGDSAKTNANVADDLKTLTIVTAAGTASAQFGIGSNGTGDEKISVGFDKLDSTTLGSGGAKLDALITTQLAEDVVKTNTKSDALTSTLDDAIKQVSTQRSKLGAAQNRLEHTIKNLDTSSENLQAAESRIRDVDMAKEMMQLTKNNILQQAAQAMLAQAQQQPQSVLQLLR